MLSAEEGVTAPAAGGEMTAGDAAQLVALHELLDAHPDATVGTLASTGLLVDHPAGLDLRGRPHMPAHSPMEIFVPEDHVAVITVFQRALIDGMAHAPVRLVAGAAGDSVVTAELHNVDLLASYGVVVAVLVPTDVAGGDGPLQSMLPPLGSRPRVARLIKNGAGGIISVDENTVAMFGYTREELLTMAPLVLVHPDDQQAAIGTWMEMLQYPDLARRGQLRYRCADGTWLWLEVTNTNRLDDPVYSCVFTDIVDISAEMSAQEELTRRERLLHQIAESLPLGLMQVDLEGTVCYTNERLLDLLGPPAGVLLAQHLTCLRPQHRRRLLALADEVTTLSVEGELEVELLTGAVAARSDSPRLLHVGLRALTQGGEGTDGIIVTFSDVTDAVQMRQALEQRASFDVLTDCLNRAELMRRLDSALSRATLGTAVVFVDMDGLKGVNDTLGHRAGDEVLRQLAERLLVERRAKQMVGRLGGDEFLVVLPAVPDAQTAEAIGERIARQVHGVLSLSDGASVQLQCSVGVSWVAAGAAGSTTLVAEADAAMYVSKKAGRGEAVSFRALPSPRAAAAPTATATTATPTA